MHRRLGLVSVATLLAVCAGEVRSQTGPYIEMGLGATVAPPITVQGSDNDWGTKCDRIINPLGLEAAGECDAAPPPTSWTNEFDGGAGMGAGVSLGYDWGAVRLEGEYFHGFTAHDDQSDINIFDDVTLDKQEQEIESAVGGVDDWRSHAGFVNAYYDFGPASASWTPYLGAGLGAARASLDYRSVWKRNDDPERISTFVDPLLRAKIAGTTTIGDARLTDVMVGYQLLAGVDYRFRQPVALGVKFRWVDLGEFASDPLPWNQLRSHESSVGRGETILYRMTMAPSRFWGLSLSLKYRF